MAKIEKALTGDGKFASQKDPDVHHSFYEEASRHIARMLTATSVCLVALCGVVTNKESDRQDPRLVRWS